MKQHLTIAAALVFAAIPALAQAQPTQGGAPRVEVGIGMATGGWFGGGMGGGALDLRVRGRLTRRFAAEFVTDLSTHDLGAGRLNGAYTVQGTCLLHEDDGRTVSLMATFGGLGGFSRVRIQAGRYVAPDGRVYEWPARTYSNFSAPTEIVGGVAVQKVLASHVAIRGDAQLIVCAYGEGAGVRLAGGASIPLGRYGTRSAR